MIRPNASAAGPLTSDNWTRIWSTVDERGGQLAPFGLRVRRRGCLVEQAAEAQRVDLNRVDRQQVATRPARDLVRPERAL